MGKPTKEELIAAFHKVDVNNTKTLGVSELYKLFQEYGDDDASIQDIDAFLAEHDINKDGFISYDEYIQFLGKVLSD